MKKRFIFLALNVASIYVFSKMAEDYITQESTYRLDLWLAYNISTIWQPWLNKLMVFISYIFSPESLLIIALLAAAYYGVKKYWYRAALVFFGSAGGLAIGVIIKIMVARPRPAEGLISETGFSFPSQHANLALIFFCLLILLFNKNISRLWLRYFFSAANLILILLIGFSRIYLKVHYVSDVIGGFALGLFWLTFLILVFRIGSKPHQKYLDYFKFRQ